MPWAIIGVDAKFTYTSSDVIAMPKTVPIAPQIEPDTDPAPAPVPPKPQTDPQPKA
jgi:hypothetical protein